MDSLHPLDPSSNLGEGVSQRASSEADNGQALWSRFLCQPGSRTSGDELGSLLFGYPKERVVRETQGGLDR